MVRGGAAVGAGACMVWLRGWGLGSAEWGMGNSGFRLARGGGAGFSGEEGPRETVPSALGARSLDWSAETVVTIHYFMSAVKGVGGRNGFFFGDREMRGGDGEMGRWVTDSFR